MLTPVLPFKLEVTIVDPENWTAIMKVKSFFCCKFDLVNAVVFSRPKP